MAMQYTPALQHARKVILSFVLPLLLLACSGDPQRDDTLSESPSPAATSGALAPAEPPRASIALCGTTLQGVIDAAAPGSILDLRGCVYREAATVNKPLTLLGGTLSTQTSNEWEVSLLIESDNVTVDGWHFTGGGVSVSILARSHVRVLNSTFRDHIGTPIAMFGAVRYVLFEGNDIVNTRTRKSSALIGRGAEEPNPCSRVARDVTIRNNFIDQGPGSYDESVTVGWFGIELKCFEDSVIEGNHVRGGHTLISLPDSNRITVRNNLLDLRGFAYWGVEIPQAHDIVIESNTVMGDGPQGNDAAFSANSRSQRMIVRLNSVRGVRTLLDAPLYAQVTDNCIVDVLNVWEYGEAVGSTIERNGPC